MQHSEQECGSGIGFQELPTEMSRKENDLLIKITDLGEFPSLVLVEAGHPEALIQTPAAKLLQEAPHGSTDVMVVPKGQRPAVWHGVHAVCLQQAGDQDL